MQLGRLEVMDQSKVDYVSKISKIQETDKKTQIDPDEQYKDAQGTLEIADNEVMLDNVKFGYNSETKDFFVRITRESGETQYPTEDMMNLKKYLMEAYKSNYQD